MDTPPGAPDEESAAEWLETLKETRPTWDPQDPDQETRENTHTFGLVAKDTPEDVAAALEGLAREWLEKVPADGPATFYVWYDAQAGTIRFSLTSQGVPTRFGRNVRETGNLETVLSEAFADPHPGRIPLAELSEDWEGEEDETPPLPVWVRSS